MSIFDFKSIKKSLQGVAAHVREIRKEIEKLKREREDVACAPASREDVKKMTLAWMDLRAADYQDKLRVTMGEAIKRASSSQPGEGVGPQAMTLVGAWHQIGGVAPGPVSVDGALCAFFGQTLADSVCKVIDQMKWPAAEGLPLAERAKKLASLDQKIDALVAEERDLVSSARSAGITLE